jgi:hypothetical protein
MRVFLIILGVIVGTAAAWGLIKLFPTKQLENKGQRIGLQIAVYTVFILLGFAFTSIFSLRMVLDKFIVNRIQDMETILAARFPNSNIMELTFNTTELVSFNNQLQQAVNDIDKSNDSFFERLAFDTFMGKLSDYIKAVNSGVTTLAAMSNDDGTVTVNAILYNLKDIALDAVSPYFRVGQIIILILFVIAVGVYIGIYFHIKKGGAMYNKSIVYGDVNDKL